MAKKAAAPPPVRPPLRPAKAQRKAWEVLAPDETGAFVGRKARKVWLWPVVERARQRIVGRTLGRRSEAPLRRRCGMPGRKSCSFSKSLAMHTTRIGSIIANYDQRILSD